MLKKSQAALEFLTTYAWAILIIVIMMGSLAYFGVFSPSKLLPDRCNFGSEVSCDKNRMKVDKSDTGPTMALTNNFGTAVTIKTIRVINSNTGSGCTGTTPADDTDWPSGSSITLTATGCGTLIVNEKIKFSVEIDYYAIAAGEGYTKTIFGEIYSSVVP